MKTEDKTLAQFIAEQNISMSARRTDRNPHMDGGETMYDHWRCTLSRPGARFSITFSMGKGHNGKAPTAEDVLNCLASDSAGLDGQTFSEWCREYGYDDDSRKALRTFQQCQKQAEKLRAFLGEESFQELLYSTERL